MDVEGLAQVLVGHRRALQVPARTASAPRGVPAGLARLGRLPHREVARVSLAGLALAAGLLEVLQLLVGEREVAGVGLHVEVDVALRRVGVALLDQTAHHRDHLGDVPGGPRLDGRTQAAQRVVTVVEGTLVLVGDLPPRRAELALLGDDLVVDVGDVPGEGHLVAAVGEPPLHHVEVEVGPDVPDVWRRLDGSAAQVDRDTTRYKRDEVAYLAGAGVVQANAHSVKRSGQQGVPRDIPKCQDRGGCFSAG